MDPKPQPNRQLYLDVLRRMTPAEKLQRMFDLSEFQKDLFLCGLKQMYPHLNAEEFHKLFLARLEKCHNRNY